MLAHLSVRDFAIVQGLEMDLAPGLTVLTGETGAGKSILVDALGLTLGERASSSVVRSGAERAEVIAVFDLPTDSDAARSLVALELDSADQECILRRTVSVDGRSRAFVNGRPVPLQVLRDLGDKLVDIHGQHAHQSLLKSSVQRQVLDEFAGHREALVELAALYDEWRAARAEMATLDDHPEAREQRLDYLRYQARELEALALEPGELESLDQEHRRLGHASELLEACSRCLEDIDGESELAAGARVARSLGVLREMVAVDSRVEAVARLLDEARIQLQEAAAELRHYADGIELDPGRLAAVDQRLTALHDVARKHHVTPEELVGLGQGLREEIATLEGSGARLAELRDIRDDLEQRYRSAARALHESRGRAARRLEEAISANMQALGMPKGSLHVRVEADFDAEPSPTGADRVTFLVTLNPGQPPAPLAKVASGGELSRVSLAIQVLATRESGVPTLIFDEVDAGIGGRVAEIVGRELRNLAERRQVLCVTHLPQVASQGHQHVQIRKQSRRQHTHTDLKSLSGEGRVQEIARMLGGVEVTEQALAHARDMLERA